MLTPEGKVYLIDLDAAMQLAPEKKSDTQLLGTAVYAAPEQFGLTRSDV
ncbi:kinase domain protein [Firmicutes bacterium CAG:238]|nr:kinase domain protein [Firmicutes bacterium CAG:238]